MKRLPCALIVSGRWSSANRNRTLGQAADNGRASSRERRVLRSISPILAWSLPDVGGGCRSLEGVKK